MGKSKAKKKGTSDAPAANKKQKCSLIEFYAQSLKTDESLKKNFVAAGSYQQICAVLRKHAADDTSAEHAVNILDNSGHLMDVVDRTVIGGVVAAKSGSADANLEEVRTHWESLKEKNKSKFDSNGGKEGAERRKETSTKVRTMKQAKAEERKKMRDEKEAPERTAKEERVKFKGKLHEARTGGMCVDFVKGECDFGSKCQWKHDDPSGELTKLNEANAAKNAAKGGKKRKQSEGDDFDPLGSSDEEEEDPLPSARREARSEEQARHAARKLNKGTGTPGRKGATKLGVRGGIDKQRSGGTNRPSTGKTVKAGKKKTKDGQKVRKAGSRHEKRAEEHRKKSA